MLLEIELFWGLVRYIIFHRTSPSYTLLLATCPPVLLQPLSKIKLQHKCIYITEVKSQPH